MLQTEIELEQSTGRPVPSTGQTAEHSASSDEDQDIDYDQPKSALSTPLKMKAGEEGGSMGKGTCEFDEEFNQESELVRCQTLVHLAPAHGFFVFAIAAWTVLFVCLCAQKALWNSDSDKEATKWCASIFPSTLHCATCGHSHLDPFCDVFVARPADFTSVLCRASPAQGIAGMDSCLFLNGSGVAKQHCPLLHPLFHSHHVDRRVEWDAIF